MIANVVIAEPSAPVSKGLRAGSLGLVSSVVILELHYGPNIVLVAFLVTRGIGAVVGWFYACRLTHRFLVPRPHGKFLLPTLKGSASFAVGTNGPPRPLSLRSSSHICRTASVSSARGARTTT